MEQDLNSSYLVRNANNHVDLLEVLAVRDLYIDVWEEVPVIAFRFQESHELHLEDLDVGETRLRIHTDSDLLFHMFAATDIVYPIVVVNDVGDLDHATVVDTLECTVE